MKILYITTIGCTMCFFENLVAELTSEGYIIDIATNNSETPVPEYYTKSGYKIYSISCSRSPFSKGNIAAIAQIQRIISEGSYDIVHCHTPLASICTRIACHQFRSKGLKVIYTAHGFHFFKGAPKINWLFYYPIERICSYWADILITINQEDFHFAQKHMKAKEILYVPGVGIDLKKFDRTLFSNDFISAKRTELGVNENEKMLLSVGELSKRKNHEIIIKALAKISCKKWKYFICGSGPLKKYLKDLVYQNELQNNVFFLGYRKDINELCACADLFVFPSLQEGLPVALMEAMAMKTPVISSKIRGSEDLLENDYMFPSRDVEQARKCIERCLWQQDMEQNIKRNYIKLKSFDITTVNQVMKNIYESIR